MATALPTSCPGTAVKLPKASGEPPLLGCPGCRASTSAAAAARITAGSGSPGFHLPVANRSTEFLLVINPRTVVFCRTPVFFRTSGIRKDLSVDTEQWLGPFEPRIADLRERSSEPQETIATSSATVGSPDSAARVTVGSHGAPAYSPPSWPS